MPRSNRTLRVFLCHAHSDREAVHNLYAHMVQDRVHAWLDTENLVMGKVRPKSLLESSFGIRRINDELTRIEHGVLS